jgi:hypothetical protein
MRPMSPERAAEKAAEWDWGRGVAMVTVGEGEEGRHECGRVLPELQVAATWRRWGKGKEVATGAVGL